MIYQVIFDITNEHVIANNILILICLAMLCALVLKGNHRIVLNYRRENTIASKPIINVLVLFIGGLFFVNSCFTISNYQDLISADKYLVEGVVKNYIPPGLRGGSPEHFCVENICFSYHDSIDTGGFNQTRLFGGPVKDGLHVKVTYVGGIITKLEIEQ